MARLEAAFAFLGNFDAAILISAACRHAADEYIVWLNDQNARRGTPVAFCDGESHCAVETCNGQCPSVLSDMQAQPKV